MNEAIIALFGAIFGGAGLKLIEQLLSRKKVRLDAETAMRKELREDLNSLREQLRATESQVDKWRDRYYTLLERWHTQRIDDPPEGL